MRFAELRGRFLGYGLVLSLAALIVANVDSLLGHGSGALGLRLGSGIVLVVEGALLALDRWASRRLLVDRVLRHFGRSRLWRVLLSPAVFLFALAFVVFGVLELARAGQTAF